MKNFTIKNKKALSIIKISVAAAFCLALWQLLSMIEGNSYFLPSVSDTFKELLLIISS